MIKELWLDRVDKMFRKGRCEKFKEQNSYMNQYIDMVEFMIVCKDKNGGWGDILQ